MQFLYCAKHEWCTLVSQYLFWDDDSGDDLKQHLCHTAQKWSVPALLQDIALHNPPEVIESDIHGHCGEMHSNGTSINDSGRTEVRPRQ